MRNGPTFMENTTNPDPTLDGLIARIWQQLVRAKHDRKSDWRWMNAATVTADGRPKVRTVVLRDVWVDDQTVVFHTDRRSQKMLELDANAQTALHFHDRRAGEQLRMEGRARCSSETVRAAAWHTLPEPGRGLYQQKLAPGRDLGATAQVGLPQTGDDDSDGYENFVVIEVQIAFIDWLSLNRGNHQRAQLEFRQRDWNGAWVAP